MQKLNHSTNGHALVAGAAFAVGLAFALRVSAAIAPEPSAASLAKLGLEAPATAPTTSVAAHDDEDGFVSPLRQDAGWSGFRFVNGGAGGLTLADMLEAKLVNSLTPVVGAPAPAAPFRLQARSEAERRRAVRCLATAIYFESALESEQGQRAVAQVVLNRVRDPNFPKSVCGVVYQGWERTTGCQFSFTCDGALLRGAIPGLYRRAEQYATDALNGYVVEEVGTATHYHADYVAPYWGPSLYKVAQIGTHIFYRWPGSPGMPGAFTGRYRGGELAFSEAVLTGRAPRPTDKPELDDLQAEGLLTDAVLLTPAPALLKGGPDRVRGILLPGGRRQPTAEDIALINARLKRFDAPAPSPGTAQPAATPALAPAAKALTPASQAADGAPTGDAVPVVEVNKPAAAG